jgi:hypothetical protein
MDLMRSFIICSPGSLNVTHLEYDLVGGCKEIYRANPHASKSIMEAIIRVNELQHALTLSLLMSYVYGAPSKAKI